MRVSRLITAILLATTGLVGIGFATESAQASSKDLQVYYSAPIKGEQFIIVGVLNPKIERKVRLQVKSGKHWKTSGETTSTNLGYFDFVRTATNDKVYRYYAPKVTINGHKYAAIVGHSKSVKLATQTASLIMTPKRRCAGVAGSVYVFVQFKPVREYRAVSLQTPLGPVGGFQDSNGRVGFSFAAGNLSIGSYSIKAVAEASQGAPAKSTATQHLSVNQCA